MDRFERISQMLSRFKRNAKGGVAVMFAVSMVAFLFVGGMALDYMRISQTRSTLQGALDAALLAAATSGDTDEARLLEIVDKYMAVNWQANHPGIRIRYNVNVGENGRLVGFARAFVKTTLLAAVGMPRVTVDARTKIARGGSVLEMALVLDTTGSMGSNNRMTELKVAAKDLVEDLMQENSNDVRIAIVPYANYVNVGMGNRGASWLSVAADTATKKWHGCVGSRNYPLDVNDDYAGVPIPGIMNVTCPTEVVRMTDQLGPLVSAIETMAPKGMTFIPGGLVWGWRAISDELPFADGTPRGVKVRNKPVRKAIVLMTDGENTASPNYPDHEGRNTALSDSLTATLCTNAKAQGVTIYTVAFEITGSTAKDVLENCATSPSMFFDAQNAAALAESFKSIGKSLTQLRIAE